jgi:hypothetical protein
LFWSCVSRITKWQQNEPFKEINAFVAYFRIMKQEPISKFLDFKLTGRILKKEEAVLFPEFIKAFVKYFSDYFER